MLSRAIFPPCPAEPRYLRQVDYVGFVTDIVVLLDDK